MRPGAFVLLHRGICFALNNAILWGCVSYIIGCRRGAGRIFHCSSAQVELWISMDSQQCHLPTSPAEQRWTSGPQTSEDLFILSINPLVLLATLKKADRDWGLLCKRQSHGLNLDFFGILSPIPSAVQIIKVNQKYGFKDSAHKLFIFV